MSGGRDHQGLLFYVQRVLLGSQAAAVLDDLRRDRTKSAERVADGSWAIGGDYWPTDGSWTPTPEITAVIGTERFAQAYHSLGDSFRRYPLTNGSHDSRSPR